MLKAWKEMEEKASHCAQVGTWLFESSGLSKTNAKFTRLFVYIGE